MREPEQAHVEHINRNKMAHMIGVAEYMRERASDYGLNPDVMYAVGFLHDIGYIKGRADHEKHGAEILGAIGVDEDILFTIAHHGENPYEVQKEYGKEVITPEFVLVLEADMSIDAKGYRVGFDGRLADIERRYGKDHIAVATVKNNIAFIKEYQQEHGIGKPTKLYHTKLHHDFPKRKTSEKER